MQYFTKYLKNNCIIIIIMLKYAKIRRLKKTELVIKIKILLIKTWGAQLNEQNYRKI